MQRDLFEPEHDSYRDALRTLLQKEVVPNYAQWERDGIVPRELFAVFGEMGTFGFGAPELHGGSGVSDFRFNAVLHEEAAELGIAPATAGAVLQADVCMPYFVHLANEDQKRRWLPDVVTGAKVAAIAMTEPGAGSDLTGIRTRAVRGGDNFVINGAKTFITNGINADLVIVVTRTGDDPHRGLSLIVVERGTPGFERGRNLAKVGQHAQDTAELSFTDVRVPAENLLGTEGEGFFGLTRNLAQERLSIAISGVAQASSALGWTIDYVRERRAFGASIGSFQNTRFTLADLDTQVDITQQYVDRCILKHNAGQLSGVDAARAKWWATDLQNRVVDACVQLHGGYGYMLEYPVARAWIDSRISRIYGGTNEIMKEIVGRSLELG